MWVVVPNLDECRDQLNARFPLRDKSSDGSIGDTSHAARASSHNPDRTGSPEFADGDALDEVRARDFDADLRDPAGVTMERVVQHWVEMARAGRLPHVRYFIYNRRIWQRSTGFQTQVYNGSNPHDKHCHVNSDYNQAADTATGVNWGLTELQSTAPAPTPSHPILQVGSKGTEVRHVQQFLRNNYPAYRNYVRVSPGRLLDVDGDYGKQTAAWVKEFQRRVGLSQDGIVGAATLSKLRAQGYKY